jgi:hypothetical protein
MTVSPRRARQVATAWAVSMALALASVGACSNNQTKCSAPSSGTFSVPLTFSQTIAVDIYCSAATGDAAACGTQPHVLDGTTLSVTVDGSSATVTVGSQSPWTCMATSPQSTPGTGPDGAATADTGCYLLVTCNGDPAGDAGSIDVQIQISAQTSSAPTGVLVLVHELGGDCCTDEYTGTWQP